MHIRCIPNQTSTARFITARHRYWFAVAGKKPLKCLGRLLPLLAEHLVHFHINGVRPLVGNE
jgi:hypothetical protein